MLGDFDTCTGSVFFYQHRMLWKCKNVGHLILGWVFWFYNELYIYVHTSSMHFSRHYVVCNTFPFSTHKWWLGQQLLMSNQLLQPKEHTDLCICIFYHWISFTNSYVMAKMLCNRFENHKIKQKIRNKECLENWGKKLYIST